jgi:hypothetical protein
MSQHNLISIQKKTITDSLNYAKGIQKAILPSEDLLREYVKDKKRIRLLPPYREHLSQAFARHFMRVGLPSGIPQFT